MSWDARGHLWVAENYTYADRIKKFDLSLRDRVLIFEDTDGDGRHDKRTVFTDDVQMLTGIEIGNGVVWLMTPPQLVFVPDANGDDQPDGAPVVMFDGFTPSTDNYHTFANGLKWGPDGWLYGRCGASSPGRIGAPDVPRVPLHGGVWRYRTSRERRDERQTPNKKGDDRTLPSAGSRPSTLDSRLPSGSRLFALDSPCSQQREHEPAAAVAVGQDQVAAAECVAATELLEQRAEPGLARTLGRYGTMGG